MMFVDAFLANHPVWAWIAMGFYTMLVCTVGVKIARND